jgi:hypothetical protein
MLVAVAGQQLGRVVRVDLEEAALAVILQIPATMGQQVLEAAVAVLMDPLLAMAVPVS